MRATVNFRHYRAAVSEVGALDPEPYLRRRTEQAAEASVSVTAVTASPTRRGASTRCGRLGQPSHERPSDPARPAMVTPLPPPAELSRVGQAALAMALAHDGPALGADEVGPASEFATHVG